MLNTTIDPLATVNHHNIIPLLASYKMMPQLLRERIIDKEVASIECTPGEIEQAYQDFYQTNQINSETELQIWLQRHNMTVPQLELTVIRPTNLEQSIRILFLAAPTRSRFGCLLDDQSKRSRFSSRIIF
jgi:hypothetical protein